MGLPGPNRAWPSPRHSLAGAIVSLALALPAWPLLTLGAQSPDLPEPAAMIVAPAPAVVAAKLTHEGNDPIITGSVAALFTSGSFSGPNESAKVDRAVVVADVVTVTAQFQAVRLELAELRAAKGGPPVPAGLEPTPAQLASVDPDASAALGAIDAAVPSDVPTPLSVPTALAYARDTAPATGPNFLTNSAGELVGAADLKGMAQAIYFEARGESYRGQVAVAQVVMNRLAYPIYPKTICGVVFQNQQWHNACQFSFACDGIPETVNDPTSWKQAMEIARGVIDGNLYLPEVANATHYHADYVYPDWAPLLKRVTKIGHHIFYKFKTA